jgi:hypothetical protein
MAKNANDDANNAQGTPFPGGDDAQDDGANDGSQTPESIEAWLEENDADGVVGPLVEAKVQKLMTALQRERENNKTLSSQLREAAKNMPSDDLKRQLEAIADERDAAVRRADFYSLAVAAGCTNVDAAYHIAVGEGAFDASGRPNIEAVKAKVPELFGQKTTPGTTNAGRGANGKPPASKTMNDLIREAAGAKV